MAIYISEDCADVWAHPELFKVNSAGTAKFVGGCPPDCFSAKG